MENLLKPLSEDSPSTFKTLQVDVLKRVILQSESVCTPLSPTSTHPEWPKVDMITSNGKVEKLVIVCECGKRLEVQCEY